jgi:RNA polymerase sigma-70 factor, ECF subfamily
MLSEQARCPDAAEHPGMPGDVDAQACSADALLVERLRRGDAEAGHRFVRDYYPSVYRYLLWLSERPEQAEDLAQETFVRAWRHLGLFDARGSLRAWLHRIAHREFLRSVRRPAPASLETVGEVAAPQATAWVEAVELRQVLRKLPPEEREVMILHYLEGYPCEEIARIVRAPVTTVKYRLVTGRSHLRRELDEGDLAYLNEQPVVMRRWAWLPLEQMRALETRLADQRPASPSEEPTRTSDRVSRRTFLTTAAGAGIAALAGGNDTDVIDDRLAMKVTLAFKATALSDLCEQLGAQTGVSLSAGSSVADDKVTLFCRQMPLRDVMRQLSRPFGYAWSRSQRGREYRYELLQDLRSQLLEEELRNRDRNAALIALEQEIERFRPYLHLSPDEAIERAGSAPPQEKALLERLAIDAWGPVQMYFRLTPDELTALRAGQEITFSAVPKPGERPLPPDVERGVLESQRYHRVHLRHDGGLLLRFGDQIGPEDLPLTAVPGVRGVVRLTGIHQSEPGVFTLGGRPGSFTTGEAPGGWYNFWSRGPIAFGRTQGAPDPENRAANAELARDPALRPSVTLTPEGRSVAPAEGSENAERVRKVTSADVLEAFHQATGLPIIADYYTRLYPVDAVSVRGMTRFEALNHLAGAMRLRWRMDGGWLQFRSATYYHDRPKEVPNRLLSRWVAARAKQGMLGLDDLVEIAQLPDPQLDADEMAEGARDYLGLTEWDLPRNGNLRPGLRFLASFTPAQRQEAQSATGLAFAAMSLAQQQEFLKLAVHRDAAPLRSLDELSGATLRVDYTVPGGFQWGDLRHVEAISWVVPIEVGKPGRRALRPPIRERTREATLEAVRRVAPQIREALLRKECSEDPHLEAAPHTVEEDQIFATHLELVFVFIPGMTTERPLHVQKSDADVHVD